MLLEALCDIILNGDQTACQIAADYLIDNISTPESRKYASWIRFSPTLHTFIDAIAKFGTPFERHNIRKVVKHALALNKIPRERTREIMRRCGVSSETAKRLMALSLSGMCK